MYANLVVWLDCFAIRDQWTTKIIVLPFSLSYRHPKPSWKSPEADFIQPLLFQKKRKLHLRLRLPPGVNVVSWTPGCGPNYFLPDLTLIMLILNIFLLIMWNLFWWITAALNTCSNYYWTKSRSTASAWLSAYADWLQTYRQTPQTGNDSYCSLLHSAKPSP